MRRHIMKHRDACLFTKLQNNKQLTVCRQSTHRWLSRKPLGRQSLLSANLWWCTSLQSVKAV